MRLKSIALVSTWRLPNALTAAADVLAGFGAAGGGFAGGGLELPLLMAASVFLYAGGVALNDVVDAADDAAHRPERPIPRGDISRRPAGSAALAAGVAGLGLAAAAGVAALLTALALLASILAYDLLFKRLGVVGAIAIGACRGFNMGLGTSLATGIAFDVAPTAVAFAAYVAALGCVGLGEERGASRGHVLLGIVAMLAFAAATALFAVSPLMTLAVLLPFLLPILFTLVRRVADRSPSGPQAVRSLVREGVLAIPGIDAAILAGHHRWAEAGVVLAILVGARLLARRLAVS